MSYSLRPYQKKCADFVLERLANYKEPLLLNLSMAAGKTWVIAEIAKRSGVNTLILTISKELCEQDYEKLSIVMDGKGIGMYSASWGRKETEPVTVATIQSAYRHPELWVEYPLIIFDECDSGASLDGTLSELVKNKMVVGLSATCYGTVGSRKGRWFTTKLWAMHKIKSKTHGWFWKPVAYNISENDLYKMGYLCPIKYFCTPTECQLLKLTSNGSEFTVDSLNEWCNHIYKRALEVMVGAEKHGMCHSGLVFLPTVESCIALEKLCQEVGIDARAVHYKTPPKTRDELVQKHKDGKIRWLINQGVFVRGFDNPRVDCMVCLRPTCSLKLWRQAMGRLIRTHPDKKIAYCFDLTENTKNWGRVEDLVMGKKKVNGYEQDTILLRGKDINGMEISKINLANVHRRKIVDSTNDIRRNNG